MSDVFGAAVVRVLKAMAGYAPEPLLDEVNHKLKRDHELLSESELVGIITADDPNEPARVNFHIQLSRWESLDHDTWTADDDGYPTLPSTAERRALVLRLLDLSEPSAARIGDVFPIHEGETVVIADTPVDWVPWYTEERASERTFYWDAYRGVLEKKMDDYSLSRLDMATREVVRRLADPSAPGPYQSKGLVVGHVQSGKTANFTGVIAKAIDAGYRLVIVLTGTIEILRSQTQRRIDMELVGRENILGGISPDDEQLLAGVDYAGTNDRDWVEGLFLEHGMRPKDMGAPEIRRLTRSGSDYQTLQAGLAALDFRTGNELVEPHKRVFDPANLYGTDVRIAVMKKNSAVLKKLVDDLNKVHTRPDEIPALIIDDEADQASVNTKKKATGAEEQERSAINKKLAELLTLMPRAQYVGYTATPFANVFVDPDDAENIFPKDFIVSLEPPRAYMGGRDFHDLDQTDDVPPTLASSNELAHVRDLRADPTDDSARHHDIERALDSYVLAGAVKLWRADVEATPGRFRHHTMLVHESVRQVEHAALAQTIHDVWLRAGYSQSHGQRRLFELWRDDFIPVSRSRSEGSAIPEDFAALRPFIGQAIDRIQHGASPIAVINGDKESEYAQPDLDFQRADVWKILVGGAKLSRGYTVEGLTTTYYTRRAYAADTLMQMGRWFGYRPGYRDLVRLFVGRDVPGPRKSRVDIYKAFEAIIRDEEEFRSELRGYQGLQEDGTPRVRPIDVPPMVFQSHPDLRPTGRAKMYNAVLVSKGEGGKVKDFFQQPPRSIGVNRRHFVAVKPLLDVAQSHGVFFSDSGTPYNARYGIASADIVREVVARFRWNAKYDFSPATQFMDQAVAEGLLTDWVVLLPELTGARVAMRRVGDETTALNILERSRRIDREFVFSGSSPRQRRAMEIISGGVDPGHDSTLQSIRAASAAYPDAASLHAPTRGAFLLTFASDTGNATPPTQLPNPTDPGDIATLFSLAFPKLSAPHGRIGFKVLVKGAGPVLDDPPVGVVPQ